MKKHKRKCFIHQVRRTYILLALSLWERNTTRGGGRSSPNSVVDLGDFSRRRLDDSGVDGPHTVMRGRLN